MRVRVPALPGADRARRKKNRERPRGRLHEVQQGVLDAVGPKPERHRAAPRRRGQRAIRAGPQLLQQALERLAVRADEPDGYTPRRRCADAELAIEDRWILSRLATVTAEVTDALDSYRYGDAARALYDFAWNEFCSFYVEMVKGRLQTPRRGRPPSGCWPSARRAAAAVAPDDPVHHRGDLAAARRRAGTRLKSPAPASEQSCSPPGRRATTVIATTPPSPIFASSASARRGERNPQPAEHSTQGPGELQCAMSGRFSRVADGADALFSFHGDATPS